MQKGAARVLHRHNVRTHTHTWSCSPSNRDSTSSLLTKQTSAIERHRPMQKYKCDRSFSNTNTHSSTGSEWSLPLPLHLFQCYTLLLSPSHSVTGAHSRASVHRLLWWAMTGQEARGRHSKNGRRGQSDKMKRVQWWKQLTLLMRSTELNLCIYVCDT